MTIIEELLKEFKTSSEDEQIKILCDRIFEEEKDKITHHNLLPQGPNVFLSLEVPGRKRSELAFVSLEREAVNKYVIVLRTVMGYLPKQEADPPPLKRQKVVEVNEIKPRKVLQKYAEFLKYMRGE